MSLVDEPTTSAPRSSPREVTMLSREIDGWKVTDDEMPKLEKQFASPISLQRWYS